MHVPRYGEARSDREGQGMFFTVFLILPIMSLLSTLSRSTARTFARTAVSGTPAIFARGEHTLPKLPYTYDVSPDRPPPRRLLEANPMLIPSDLVACLGPRAIHLEGDHGTPS